MTHQHTHVYDSEVGFVKTSAKDGTPVYSLKCACGKVWGHFHGNRIPDWHGMNSVAYISDLPAAYDRWKGQHHVDRMNYTPNPQQRSLPPAPPPQCGFKEDK
jgi:hypothetical protein